jgi:uncharacterized protein (TIGR02588 family)
MPNARAKKVAETPMLEWIAAGVGLVFLLGVLIAIGHDALTGASQAPPAIEIEQSSITKTTNGYVVSFVAHNRSGGTAAALEVEAQLTDGYGKIETSSATLDYVPGHGDAHGGVYFYSNPRAGRLTLRALGYQRP